MAVRKEIENDVLKAEPFLRGYAMSLCRHHEKAEDLYQETVCKALENADKFQAGTNLEAWMCTIMRNLHTNIWRKHRLEVYGEEADIPVESDFDSNMMLEDIGVFLERLPKGWGEQLIEHVVDGKTFTEISRETGKPVSTIKVQVFRTREKLRKMMEAV